MSPSVWVAAVSVGMMVLARVFMGVLALLSGTVSIVSIVLPVAVAVLILIGIIAGQRLAWQWGRLLGLLGGIVLTMAAVGAFANANGEVGMLVVGALLLLQGAPLFPMFFALGMRGAREHFRLICPACGHARPRGGNFLFTEAVCRKCAARWK
ncbi:MAG: hypothetical protein RBR19_17485 [Sedimentisphaerales bacterium]|nr:hypothetical protein [Sedimentisphaerales bacterium]NLT77638.1 hypothetical protein [Planctomycetota bacterium]